MSISDGPPLIHQPPHANSEHLKSIVLDEEHRGKLRKAAAALIGSRAVAVTGQPEPSMRLIASISTYHTSYFDKLDQAKNYEEARVALYDVLVLARQILDSNIS
jgi:hypothetical protein